MRIPYYAIFDPFHLLSKEPLRVYSLAGSRYVRNEKAMMPDMNLGLRIWPGGFEGLEFEWARFTDGAVESSRAAMKKRSSLAIVKNRNASEPTHRKNVPTRRRSRARTERRRADKLAANFANSASTRIPLETAPIESRPGRPQLERPGNGLNALRMCCSIWKMREASAAERICLSRGNDRQGHLQDRRRDADDLHDSRRRAANKVRVRRPDDHDDVQEDEEGVRFLSLVGGDAEACSIRRDGSRSDVKLNLEVR